MNDRLTLSQIADALDTLADILTSDRTTDLAGYNITFWRDAAAVLRAEEREKLDRCKTGRSSL